MGPREALYAITSLIKAGLASNDVSEIHGVLLEIERIAQATISQRGLRHRRRLNLPDRSRNVAQR